MKIKSPIETIEIFDGNKLNGLQILEKFHDLVLHSNKQKEARELWKDLSHYLDEQEEHDLFVSWSKLRLNQGSEDFTESIIKIKDRMNNHLIV